MINELIAIAVGISISSLIIGSMGLFFGLRAFTECVGLKNSTHQVQFMPLDQQTPEDKDLDEFIERQNSSDDPLVPEDNDSETEFVEKSLALEKRRKKKQKFDDNFQEALASEDFMGTNW